MSESFLPLYEFGPFLINKVEGLLLCRGVPVSLTPKAFETLLSLIEIGGRVASRTELLERIWPDSFVEENNLSQNVSLLRKTLQQVGGGECAKYIETVPRRGYRLTVQVVIRHEQISPRKPAQTIGEERQFLSSLGTAARASLASVRVPEPTCSLTSISHAAAVTTFDPAAADFNSPAAETMPETRYAQSGNVNIAYQVVGRAPLDLVFVMGWVSHLEYFWKEPTFARFLRRLASFSRLILFDKRGTGLSDKVPVNQLPTLEQRMDDVRAVMDAAGSERAAILGVSEGGPMSALFAATYPEKTTALAMIGTYAKRIWDPAYPWAPTIGEREKFISKIQETWGGPVGLEERAPSKLDDPVFCKWWATYLRMGASPGAAVALTRMNAEIDVRQVLPSVRVPTLVLHRAGDACLKTAEGRYVAGLIPNSKFVELPGTDHLPFVGDQEAMVNEIEEFLTGVRHEPVPDRVLATVLFMSVTDRSVNHTPAGEADGHVSPGGVTDGVPGRLREYVRKKIGWFRGREIDLSGNGPLAVFDGPARAVRCACTIKEYAERLGFVVRAGLHTGECDFLGADGMTGLAIEIGNQIRARAGAGNVLVSSTVKDLVAGSGIRFLDSEMHSFTGAASEWRLFKAEC